MPRLKDRSKQIPNGLKFYEPSLKWKPAPYSSLSTIVQGLIQARRANPYLLKKNGWSVDPAVVTDEVDRYNAAICKAHGWDQYITMEGDSPPKFLARTGFREAAGHAVAGVNIVMDMFGMDGPIRDRQLAEKRALICAGTDKESRCPNNDQGDWTRFFTVPAQAVIRKALSIAKDLELKTSHDDQINVCTACGCPLKGKVWARLEHIVTHMPPGDRAKLDPRCWILHEQASSQAQPEK